MLVRKTRIVSITDNAELGCVLLLLVGRQFIAAEELLFTARHASYWESLDAGVNCFMLAIEVGVVRGVSVGVSEVYIAV